jgi:hypothetical protein
MAANADLIERSGDLKRALVDYALQPRFDHHIDNAIEQRFGPEPELDEADFANFIDWFILQERLPDGRTVVERFVADHPELPEEERAMLLGWRDVVEGIFEVKRRDGEALVVVNLLDELTYRVRSNMGPAIFARRRPGSFLMCRLVPLGDEWLLSGVANVLPGATRTEVYRHTAELATQFPSLAFRNPEKLARAWELQREERRHFIDFFGSDLVVLPGSELGERIQAYTHFSLFEARDADGKSAVERARETYGVEPPPLDFSLPDELHEAETVGLIYDEIEGLNFFIDFHLVEETFANPALAAEREHREAVFGYLQDPSISPLPFHRLAERDPERASQVFQRVLKKPRFSWERDGEALLRKHKASFYEHPVLPSVMPLSEQLSRVQITAPEPDRPRPDWRPGRRQRSGVRGKRRRSR